MVALQSTILRIEAWHGLLLILLLVILAPARMVEPWALIGGGLFMGVNFFLLSFGVWWVLTPLAGKGRVKLGVCLLVLKLVLFLGLLGVLFFKFDVDIISFAVGFSSLLGAIVFEMLRATLR